jgi:DHA2 family multidrug resistance protein
LLVVALSWALLFDRQSKRQLIPFDSIGFILLIIALGCLQTALNQGQDEDWYNSSFIVSLFALGFLVLAYFVVWELAEKKPLLDLRLLARRNFSIGAFVLSISFMLMYGLLSVLLVRLQVVAGYTSFLAGSVLLPLLFLAKPMASFYHRVVHYVDSRWLASMNMLAFALYCFWSSHYDFFNRNSFFDQTLASQVLEGFCLGGLFVPLTTIFLSDLTPRRQTQAVELGGMLRVLGGSIASPLFGLFWERRAAFHQARLSETLSAYDSFGRDSLTALNNAGFHGQLANANLATMMNQHASILGVADAFRVASWIFLGLAVLVWFAYPVPPKRLTTSKQSVRETAFEDLIEEP